MTSRAKALIATSALFVLAAWLGPACMVGPLPEPGMPGGDQTPGSGGAKDGGTDGGSADGGLPAAPACSAVCRQAVPASGCSSQAAAADCSARCLASLTGGWKHGSIGVDAVGRIFTGCELNPPPSPCAGRTGDELASCLTPYLERCTELCRCQSSCSPIFAAQHACNEESSDCATYQACMSARCVQPALADAGAADAGALTCVAGSISFAVDGKLRTACATSIFQGASVIAAATGADETGSFDVRLTLESLVGVHPVPPLDAARQGLIEINVEGRSYGSANGSGVVVINSTASRYLIGAFKVQVVDKVDATKRREISGSFDVRY